MPKMENEVMLKVGDRVSAQKVPILGTIKAKGVSRFTVQVRWDDGEWGWCDVRDLTLAVPQEYKITCDECGYSEMVPQSRLAYEEAKTCPKCRKGKMWWVPPAEEERRRRLTGW
ncbi:unnamed protein product [marine sediment metagenome]|uniref:DUF4314 domain-containing protein n=1 Tax=marine sediment metagenome TaxID=412755 RepID=X1R6K9_9ZZZZ